MNSNPVMQTKKTQDTATDPRLSQGTKEFLKVLNSPAPPALEKMSPVEAKKVLADAQASIEFDYSGLDKSEKRKTATKLMLTGKIWRLRATAAAAIWRR